MSNAFGMVRGSGVEGGFYQGDFRRQGDPVLVLIAGATAVGKSQLALDLAARLGGEIISVDSMQVYRGLDIGTDKPSLEVRALVRHHLVDILEVDERFDAAQFVRRANAAIEDIKTRGKIPILCGGTGLYFKAWLYGLGDAPRADSDLRSLLEETPLSELLAEIEVKDPLLYQTLDRENPRRVIRAVEVIRLTGKPFSAVQAQWAREPMGKKLNVAAIALRRSPEEMSSRIEQRVERMMAAGLIEETEALLERGLEKNPTAMQAIGYRQVVEYLNGDRNREETVALIKQKTRQLARRQGTWFRRQLNFDWIDWGQENVQAVSERVLQRARERGLGSTN